MNEGTPASHHIGPVAFTVWQALFGLLIAAYGLIIVATYSQYGITSDEHLTVAYGKAVVAWYTSGFQDRAVFHSHNTYLYGGFLNAVVHLIHRVTGGDIYNVGHVCNALVGLLGVVAAYRLGCLLGDVRTGFLAALFLLLTPRYYGHAFNNPRDIPFAVFYLWSVYYILRCTLSMPNLPWHLIAKTGLAIGLALGIRAGGVILWVYLIMCTGLGYWLAHQKGRVVSPLRSLFPLAAIVGLSYGVMFVFWPLAQVYPVAALWKALRVFSNFPDVHYSFFEGLYLGNHEIPRYYALRWLLITLPEFVFAGLILLIFLAIRVRHVFSLPVYLLLGMAIFPVAYAVCAGTPLYDGIRHLLFAVPPLIMLSAWAVDRTCDMFKTARRRAIFTAGIGLLVGWTFWEMIALHPHQYVYFNRAVAGGIEKASATYETDYWEHSYKHGVQWIETQVPYPNGDRKWRVAGFYNGIQDLIDPVHFEFVQPGDPADFYLGTTRFDRHCIIPGEVLHIVRAKTVPLLFVIRPDTLYQRNPMFAQSAFRHIYLADLYTDQEDYGAAIAACKTALDLMPGKERHTHQIAKIHLKFANNYFRNAQYDEALHHYHLAAANDKHREIVSAAQNNIGLMHAHRGQFAEAVAWHQKAIEKSPDYDRAYENLGDAYVKLKRFPEAILAYGQTLYLNPGNGEIHHKLGLIYASQERYAEALPYLQKAAIHNPRTSEDLGDVCVLMGRREEALAAYQQASQVVSDPRVVNYKIEFLKAIMENH